MKALALLFAAQVTAILADPCVDHHYIYDEGSRSTKCPSQSGACDRYITENWYKVVNYNGPLEMPTTQIPLNSCGANNPVWLKGNNPGSTDDVVDKTACVVTPIDPCGMNITIQVKNCGSFFVYYLKKLEFCPQRYCFGTNGVCPTTTTTTTTTTLGTTPTLSRTIKKQTMRMTTVHDPTMMKTYPPTDLNIQENTMFTTGVVLMVLAGVLLGGAVCLFVSTAFKQRTHRSCPATPHKPGL